MGCAPRLLETLMPGGIPVVKIKVEEDCCPLSSQPAVRSPPLPLRLAPRYHPIGNWNWQLATFPHWQH